ncbi:hypothetical protein SAY87_019767 [Trapa incisa]|uniref:Histidine--tRNA ligase, cytoplasmic n=1 Tax=Trapa incisa TaxID=236973 RepID=A0AAN7K5D5_9MYRT|nr:hypothetical protein SAY87_019767 [Trapa incisa]
MDPHERGDLVLLIGSSVGVKRAPVNLWWSGDKRRQGHGVRNPKLPPLELLQRSANQPTAEDYVRALAMSDGDGKTVTVGGKGSALAPSSVFAVANGLAKVHVDSSALDRLASSRSSPSATHQVAFPSKFTPEERRASFMVLLGKLVLSGAAGTRTTLPELISGSLNSTESPEVGPLSVTEEELSILEKSGANLYGVCALLDYQTTLMSTVVDAVAALSCEAIKADVSAFNSVDAGDGFTSKEEIGVSSDMKVLLNGSKMVGKVEVEAVCSILKINATLRKVVKSMHLDMRANLNSTVKVGKSGSRSDGAAEAAATALLSLASALQDVGQSSLFRAKVNLDTITLDSLRNSLEQIFQRHCTSADDLRGRFRVILDTLYGKDYDNFVHEVFSLSNSIWKIVAWEAISAFAALEGPEFTGKGMEGEVNRENVSVDKKSEKKKKKLVLGKGTSVLVQLIKDGLQGTGENAADSSDMVERSVQKLLLFFDIKHRQFDVLLKTLKDILESNESRRLPKIPKGTRDFAKEQMSIREKAFSIITEVFKKHGATALDTPVFELRETLMGKYGEDSKLIYDLADQGGELCSLRYDLTVPFARYMAMNGLTSMKRYHIAKVYRRDNPSKGRYREFYQCDFDIAGQHARMQPDSEVIKIMTELLDKLNIGDYEVKLNHRKLLDGMLELCGVPMEKFRTICSSVDKLDKQPFDQIRKEMVEEKGLTAEMADGIGEFVKKRGRPLELLSELQKKGSKFLENEGSVQALNDLEILFKALEKAKCIDKIVFDLSLARGLDYYTGVIYEAVFKGVTQQIIRATETQVLVGFLGEDLPLGTELVNEFWQADVKAELSLSKRVMKHIDHAKDSRIPYMVLVGERELNEGVVKLKDIEAAKEEAIPRSQMVEEVKRRLLTPKVANL